MGLRFQDQAEEAYRYPLLVGQLLHTSLATAPEQEIVYRDRHRCTYANFERRIHRLANALAELKVEQGTTVAVLDWDSHRYLEAFFAVPMMGAVLLTVNVRLSPRQIGYTLQHAAAEVILVHRDFADLLADLREALPEARAFVWIDDSYSGDRVPQGYVGEYETLLARAGDVHDFGDFDENAIATTFYTTGTTGDPKAVSFSHRQIVLHTLATLAQLSSQAPEGLTRGDVYMPLTPMFHVHAWGLPYVATLLGLKQVYPGKYDPQTIIELRDRERVSFSHCVPTILQMVMDAADESGRSLEGWTLIIGGAAFTTEQCIAATARGMRVLAAYGMSETGPVLTITRSRLPEGSGTAQDRTAILCKTGLPIPLVQVRIVDSAMNDVAQDNATQGEIIVRAPWLTPSYLGNASASAELWRGGWLHTQDIATIDRHGYIQIRDRLKDVIKSGGEWISSLQLESLLVTHAGIAEVAVVGAPDPRWSERPVAFFVPSNGSTTPSLADLRNHLQPQVDQGLISRFALPYRAIAIAALPRTSVGKINKKALRRMAAEDSSEQGASVS